MSWPGRVRHLPVYRAPDDSRSNLFPENRRSRLISSRYAAHVLFVPQGDHGIDKHGPAGGDESG